MVASLVIQPLRGTGTKDRRQRHRTLRAAVRRELGADDRDYFERYRGPSHSDLALRSIAVHGYSAEFLEACRAELTITPTRHANETVRVAEQSGRGLGFVAVAVDHESADLMDLFVEPDERGSGVGSTPVGDGYRDGPQRRRHPIGDRGRSPRRGLVPQAGRRTNRGGVTGVDTRQAPPRTRTPPVGTGAARLDGPECHVPPVANARSGAQELVGSIWSLPVAV